ncbi:class I SAM-dependent methyltransferase [Peribacillus kribbensis]|uniref:class I SAM-dependent methyltransferase n=1 Tax=Peribacillus kribbensis TaxID=356658 RepID=UPI00041A1D60|nr:class I SAM-dependent methyltransferase [Peribacillus kribbensis]
MQYRGSSVYDKDEFFEHYMNRRHREESPNESIETPSLFELLGCVEGKDLLDLGCGDASIGKMLLTSKGARSYTGVDGSKNMCKKAEQNLAGLNGKTVEAAMESYDFTRDTFDIILSQLAIHYIEDFSALAANIHKALKPHGTFVFSVQHPLITSSFESLQASGRRSSWLVDNYYFSGQRIEPWIGEQVVKYHRTIEEYFITLQKAGFTIHSLREATPRRENFSSQEEYERRMRIPLFLLFGCNK